MDWTGIMHILWNAYVSSKYHFNPAAEWFLFYDISLLYFFDGWHHAFVDHYGIIISQIF